MGFLQKLFGKKSDDEAPAEEAVAQSSPGMDAPTNAPTPDPEPVQPSAEGQIDSERQQVESQPQQ